MKQVQNAGGNEKPLTISELAKRHFNDPNHTTSDEELRSAQVELTTLPDADRENLHEVNETTVIPPMSFEKDPEEIPAQEDDVKKNKAVPNPDQVLG